MRLRRWELALVGGASGEVHRVSFMRFWRRATAEEWAARVNRRAIDVDVLRWEVRRR